VKNIDKPANITMKTETIEKLTINTYSPMIIFTNAYLNNLLIFINKKKI